MPASKAERKYWKGQVLGVLGVLCFFCIPDIFPGAWPPVVFALDQSLPARSSPCGAARVGKPTAEKNWRMI